MSDQIKIWHIKIPSPLEQKKFSTEVPHYFEYKKVLFAHQNLIVIVGQEVIFNRPIPKTINHFIWKGENDEMERSKGMYLGSIFMPYITPRKRAFPREIEETKENSIETPLGGIYSLYHCASDA